MIDPILDARPDHRRTAAAACMSPAARRRPNPAAAVAIGVLAGVMEGVSGQYAERRDDPADPVEHAQFTSKRNASPSRTTCPAVGAAK